MAEPFFAPGHFFDIHMHTALFRKFSGMTR
jgi:hypothetical protein